MRRRGPRQASWSTLQPGRRLRLVGLFLALTVGGCALWVGSTARADTGNPPQNTVPPSISGAAAVFDTVSCNPGQWTPADVTFTYQWLVGGEMNQDTPATQTWKLGVNEYNQQISCEVTATDPATSLHANANSSAETVQAGEIDNTGPPSISGTPSPGNTLICSQGQWDPTPDSFSYQWLLDGNPIQGATTSTYEVAQGDVGHRLSCDVIATIGNGAASGNQVSNEVTVTAAPPKGSPPANTALPAISGTAAPGQTVSCSTGTWTNSPTGYAYRWLLDSAAIGGATASTHAIGASEAGHQLACRVTATNSFGSGSATSTPVTVAQGAPVNSVGPFIVVPAPRGRKPGPPAYGLTATCNPGTWSGSPTFAYRWLEIGPVQFSGFPRVLKRFSLKRAPIVTRKVLQLGVGPALVMPDLDPAAARIFCEVTATGGGTKVVADSEARTIGVVRPAQPKRCLVLGTRATRSGPCAKPHILSGVGINQTNTCTAGAWSHYPTSFEYRWYKLASGATKLYLHGGQTYTVDSSLEGEQVLCVVTAVNRAGRTQADSNTYTVPLRPLAEEIKPPFVEVRTQQPASDTGILGPRDSASVVGEQIDLKCIPQTTSVKQPGVTIFSKWALYPGVAASAPGEQPVLEPGVLNLDMRPGNAEYDEDIACVTLAWDGRTEWGSPVYQAVVSSGVIGIWNGCFETQVQTYDATKGLTATEFLLEAGPFLILGPAGEAASPGFAEGAWGLFWNTINTGGPSTTVYTYGPNCRGYQKYYENQGFTVKQRDGLPP